MPTRVGAGRILLSVADAVGPDTARKDVPRCDQQVCEDQDTTVEMTAARPGVLLESVVSSLRPPPSPSP